MAAKKAPPKEKPAKPREDAEAEARKAREQSEG